MEQRRKQIKGKIIFKHQTASEWNLSSYVPDEGERILYDPDVTHNYVREKFGDGERMVKDLPFVRPTYECALEAGYEGTETQFKIDFLKALTGSGSDVSMYIGEVEVSGQ
jgi:hypothetical protein